MVRVQGCQAEPRSWHSSGTSSRGCACSAGLPKATATTHAAGSAAGGNSWTEAKGRHGAGCFHRDHVRGAPTAGLPRFNNPRGAQVPLFSARVLVSLRPSVLDPAGEATRAAAARLGVDGVSKLRIGKAVEVELEAADAQAARTQLELLSDRLLANPVIENWTLELKDDSSAGA